MVRAFGKNARQCSWCCCVRVYWNAEYNRCVRYEDWRGILIFVSVNGQELNPWCSWWQRLWMVGKGKYASCSQDTKWSSFVVCANRKNRHISRIIRRCLWEGVKGRDQKYGCCKEFVYNGREEFEGKELEWTIGMPDHTRNGNVWINKIDTKKEKNGCMFVYEFNIFLQRWGPWYELIRYIRS